MKKIILTCLIISSTISKLSADIVTLTTSCEHGNMRACVDLGVEYYNNDKFKNDSLFVKYSKIACDGNHADGCHNVGYAYGKGIGVSKDILTSIEYYSKSCNQGSGLSCFYVAMYHRNKTGKQIHVKKSFDFLTKSCDLNSSKGCGTLGDMYLNGFYVNRNYQKALVYYEQACEMNLGAACNNIAFMYENGYGTKKDYNVAVKYYFSACEKGYKSACSKLGNNIDILKNLTSEKNMSKNEMQKSTVISKAPAYVIELCSTYSKTVFYKYQLRGYSLNDVYDKCIFMYKKGKNITVNTILDSL